MVTPPIREDGRRGTIREGGGIDGRSQINIGSELTQKGIQDRLQVIKWGRALGSMSMGSHHEKEGGADERMLCAVVSLPYTLAYTP